ncbi:NUDIX hydrolase [Gimesia sp.]|uniref:NUDIX hydrolase n=1 Tax=Gimesia sp. TaxID=2024833 RepID=UPI003A91E4F1
MLISRTRGHRSREAPQIPGGTIEPGETPEAAALREAREETGLSDFSSPALIARQKMDLEPFGKQEVIDAWFYHLQYEGERKKRWRHAEQTPGDGSLQPILFELYWVPLRGKVSLNGADGLYLERITFNHSVCQSNIPGPSGLGDATVKRDTV